MKLLIIASALFLDLLGTNVATASVFSKDHKYPKRDCQEIFAGIGGLLEEADKEWAHLENNPEGSPDALEHAAKIQWYIGLAADYTTIYEAFCNKD